MRFTSLLLFLVLSVGLVACGAPDTDPTVEAASPDTASSTSGPAIYETRGVVRSVTPSGSYIRIQHGDIPGFMDAMTMAFAVADSVAVDGVARDDSIAFAFVAGTAGVTIQSVERIER